MKISRLLLIFGLILGILLSSTSVFASDQGKGQVGEFAAERILVKFKAGTSEAAKHQIHRAQGAAVIGEVGRLGVHILKIPAGKVPEMVLAYRNNPAVAYAEPDYIATAFEVGTDPKLNEQWGMTTIQAPEAWVESTGLHVKIAILDTGVDQNHEDLIGKIVDNMNFTDSSTYDDRYGHGTHVAGIAAAVTNNGLGVAGVGAECQILNGKVLADDGSGAYSWIANGIIWAADSGAKVINMSLGGRFGSYLLQDAVNYAWGKGVVIAAAAGNNGTSKANYPAYYANCIAVAATDAADAKASFSNYGSWVDVAAPGVGIMSTMPNHDNEIGLTNYGSLSGTSMATPFVAGLAGLVWATGYGTSASSVRDRIESTAVEVGSIWSAYGIERINAYQAVMDSTANTAPVVTIISPNNGVHVAEGTPITFSGSALDAEDGDVAANLVWRSDLDGQIGTGASFTRTLSVGTHLITATVTDSKGATGTASVTIVVDAGGLADEHTYSLFGRSEWVNKVTWHAIVDVTISPSLAGATVTGIWSNGVTATGTTNESSICTLTSPNLNKKISSVTFTVTSITCPGYTFVPSDKNSETINMP